MENNLFRVENLSTSFFTHLGEVQAVRDIGFSIGKEEVLGIVGESGSGKSVTALSCMRLIQSPGKITGGSVWFRNEDLLKKSNRQMRDIRGNRIAMIFQNPMTSLNAVLKIGEQIAEPLMEHKKLSRKEAMKKAVGLLEKVQIPDASRRIHSYPHEFSGGMRQRAMIAMALSCDPDLIIADEPTTAIDVTIQSQVLDLMRELKKEFSSSLLLITHDLGVIAEICSRVVVMYGSMIMEEASVEDLFYKAAHPYTLGLLKSIPRPGRQANERLNPIAGTPPVQLNPSPGCPFAPRCEFAMKICRTGTPGFTTLGDGHRSACWLLHENAPANPLRKGE
ncbi:MAG: ABC transporter ATP-binding protein [Spirochaetales bacterium]|nr:ABC transporter ATP-binding protein [Spirochaetales bacterium]